jgi:hypothetical protein
MESLTVSQPALFLHGGYGATQVRSWRVCYACRRAELVSVAEVNPRHHL